MTSKLESRFLSFISGLPGAESIDTLLAGNAHQSQRRADYLLFNRRLIVEVKSLETDTSSKVETEMDRHRDRDDFPLMYGEVALDKVLQNLPDGDKINERIFEKIARSVEAATRSAEDQLETTANIFDLPRSAGILVILNEGIEILTPEVVAARVGQLLRRSRTNGTSSPIALAWLHFEGHSIPSGPAKVTLPIVQVEGQRAAEHPDLEEFMRYLNLAWATCNNRPVYEPQGSGLETLAGIEAIAANPNQQRMPRQAVWRRQYFANPHLRELGEQDLVRYGRTALDRITPYFIVNGPRISPNELEPLMITWSDFLCEAQHRGIDLRVLRGS